VPESTGTVLLGVCRNDRVQSVAEFGGNEMIVDPDGLTLGPI
jgi:hypothetical protein